MNYFKYLIKSLSIWFILLSPDGYSGEPEKTITWYRYDLPPYHILRGNYQNQGPLDYIYSLWQQWLPEYQHKAVSVNTARMSREFQSEKDLRCITSSFIFPESEGHWVWSSPLYVEPPAVVVMNKKVAEKYATDNSVDFGQLIKNKNITFGHFDGRIYAGEIDSQINAHIGKPNVIAVGSYAPGESLMRMLQRGRVDYILEYLPEIHWLMLSDQLESEVNFVALDIKSHMALSPVHLGCANTDWGRKTIDFLNQRINQQVRQAIWLKYEKWLYNDFAIQRFRNTQKHYFSDRDK